MKFLSKINTLTKYFDKKKEIIAKKFLSNDKSVVKDRTFR